MSGVERVREAIDAINRRDVDGFFACTHPDFEWSVLEASFLAGTYRGREQLRAYIEEEWLNNFERIRLKIEEIVELGDHVLVLIHGSAAGKASGVEVANRFCHLWTVTDGVPTRMREYATREEALAAAGADG